MSSDFRPTTWGEEISLEYGKALRDYASADGAVPVFGTNGQVGWTDTPLANGPGIILGRKGAYRGIEYCKVPFFVIDTAYYVKPKLQVNMRWLYYAMVHHQLGSIDDGSPIPSTTRAAVYVRELTVPKFEIQNSISKVLGDLDDKIALLRNMNVTLEAMVRAVFRAWFVEFEPVHAKAAGAMSFRGMPNDAFESLPHELEESLSGKLVPRGWEQISLSRLVDVNPARRIKKGSVTPYIGMAEIPLAGSSIESWGLREFSSGAKFQNGDTLLARITPCLENGKTALVDMLKDGEIGGGSTEFIVLGPTDQVGPEFIYCLARDQTFREYAIKNMNGTSGRQRVTPDSIAAYPMHKASKEAYLAFGQFASPFFGQITANRNQITILSQLRDTLLPKLITGELEAPQLEELAYGG